MQDRYVIVECHDHWTDEPHVFALELEIDRVIDVGDVLTGITKTGERHGLYIVDNVQPGRVN